jgi:hypothetical protein
LVFAFEALVNFIYSQIISKKKRVLGEEVKMSTLTKLVKEWFVTLAVVGAVAGGIAYDYCTNYRPELERMRKAEEQLRKKQDKSQPPYHIPGGGRLEFLKDGRISRYSADNELMFTMKPKQSYNIMVDGTIEYGGNFSVPEEEL